MSPLFYSLLALIFGARIAYSIFLLSLPIEEQRRYALRVWIDTIILAITTTVVLFLPSMGIGAGNVVEEEIGYDILPSISISVFDPGIYKDILINASNKYFALANQTASDLGTLTSGIIILGIIPFTQAASMGLSQLSSMYYSTAIPVLIGSWIAGYTAKMAAIMVELFPVFALMVATGRKILGILGAGLASFVTVACPILPIVAGVIASEAPSPLPQVVKIEAGMGDVITYGITHLHELIPKFFDLAFSIAPHAMFYARAMVIFVFASFIMAGATASLSSILSDVPQFFEVPI